VVAERCEETNLWQPRGDSEMASHRRRSYLLCEGETKALHLTHEHESEAEHDTALRRTLSVRMIGRYSTTVVCALDLPECCS
jgi:hypothetical protein